MSTTKAQLHYIETAEHSKGARIGSRDHRAIIDTFNQVKPDGWAMTYTAPWCATAASAWAIEAFGKKLAKKYFPLSANCGTIINSAMKMGIWVESDKWVPVLGSWILYDWNDSGTGDNRGVPDHVGVIIGVSGRRLTVLEGNKGNPGTVGTRQVMVDGRYIRGYVNIDWKALNREWQGVSQSAAKTTGKASGKASRKAGTYQVTAPNGLNVRTGPGVVYHVIRAIGKGSKFKVTKILGTWGYAPALSGWLCLDFAKKIK